MEDSEKYVFLFKTQIWRERLGQKKVRKGGLSQEMLAMMTEATSPADTSSLEVMPILSQLPLRHRLHTPLG